MSRAVVPRTAAASRPAPASPIGSQLEFLDREWRFITFSKVWPASMHPNMCGHRERNGRCRADRLYLVSTETSSGEQSSELTLCNATCYQQRVRPTLNPSPATGSSGPRGGPPRASQPALGPRDVVFATY